MSYRFGDISYGVVDIQSVEYDSSSGLTNVECEVFGQGPFRGIQSVTLSLRKSLRNNLSLDDHLIQVSHRLDMFNYRTFEYYLIAACSLKPEPLRNYKGPDPSRESHMKHAVGE